MEANVGWTESDGWEEFVQYYSKIFKNRKKNNRNRVLTQKKNITETVHSHSSPPIATLPVIVDLMTFIWSTLVGRLAQKHSHIHTHTHTHEHGHLIAFTTTIFRYLSEAKLIVTPLLGTATE